MVSLFALLKNPIELETYIREGAALLQVSEEALYSELRARRNKERRIVDFSKQPSVETPAPASVVRVSPERSTLLTLFALAVASQDNAREICDLLPPETLEGESLLCRALNLLLAGAAGGESEEDIAAALNNMLTENNDEELGKLLIKPPVFSDPEKALTDSVSELIRIYKRRRYAEIMAEIRSCNDPERRFELMKQLKEFSK